MVVSDDDALVHAIKSFLRAQRLLGTEGHVFYLPKVVQKTAFGTVDFSMVHLVNNVTNVKNRERVRVRRSVTSLPVRQCDADRQRRENAPHYIPLCPQPALAPGEESSDASRADNQQGVDPAAHQDLDGAERQALQ